MHFHLKRFLLAQMPRMAVKKDFKTVILLKLGSQSMIQPYLTLHLDP